MKKEKLKNKKNMDNKKEALSSPQKKSTNWWGLMGVLTSIVVTIIGIAYTVNREEKQRYEATIEREKAVKNELILIIEESILNDNVIDITKLSRFLYLKIKEANIKRNITLLELVSKAEFNFQNSNYLNSEKKIKYSESFSKLYTQMHNYSNNGISSAYNQNIINDIISELKKNNNSIVIKKLALLVSEYDAQLEEVTNKHQNNGATYKKIIYALFNSPELIFILSAVYAGIVFTLLLRRRRLRKPHYIDIGNNYKKNDNITRKELIKIFADD